jgi:chromosome segregation ATPase
VTSSGKTSQDDLMQLKEAFDMSKEQFRKIYNEKDLEIFSMKGEIKEKDAEFNELLTDFEIQKKDLASKTSQLLNATTELILLRSELEKNRNFLEDLNGTESIDVVVVQKLKKLLQLEQSNQVLELNVTKISKEKEEIEAQKLILENTVNQLKEELKVSKNQIDELVMKNKTSSYELEILEDQVQKGKEEIIGIQGSNRKYMSQVERYETEIEKYKSTVAQMKQDNTHLQNKIKTLDTQLNTMRDGKDYDVNPEVNMYKDEIQKHIMDKKRLEGDLEQAVDKSKERIKYFQSLNDSLTTELESLKFFLRNQEEKHQKTDRDRSNELTFLRQQMDKKVDEQILEVKAKQLETQNMVSSLKKELDEQHKIIQKKSKDEVNLTSSLSNLKEELTKATHQNVELQLKILQLEETVEKTVPTLNLNKSVKKSFAKDSNGKPEFNESNLIFVDPGSIITSEDLSVFPLLAVKKGILLLVSYFEQSVSEDNVSLHEIGDTSKHPELVDMIIKTTCEPLAATFRHHYTGNSWFSFGAQVHFWKMFEELSTLHDREGKHGKELREAILNANSSIDGFVEFLFLTLFRFLRKNYLPDGMDIQDAKFYAFIFYCLK